MSHSTPTTIDQVDPNLLPPQIRRFVALIGMAETVKMLQAVGGLPVKFTGTCAWLRGVISDEAIQVLVAEFKDQELSMPKFDKVAMQLRNLAIKQSLESGQSGRAVARDNNLTYRMIKIIKTQLDDNPTGDLFS